LSKARRAKPKRSWRREADEEILDVEVDDRVDDSANEENEEVEEGTAAQVAFSSISGISLLMFIWRCGC
jgi:hypothetical protein